MRIRSSSCYGNTVCLCIPTCGWRRIDPLCFAADWRQTSDLLKRLQTGQLDGETRRKFKAYFYFQSHMSQNKRLPVILETKAEISALIQQLSDWTRTHIVLKHNSCKVCLHTANWPILPNAWFTTLMSLYSLEWLHRVIIWKWVRNCHSVGES